MKRVELFDGKNIMLVLKMHVEQLNLIAHDVTNIQMFGNHLVIALEEFVQLHDDQQTQLMLLVQQILNHLA
eukprot:jgi/Picsp_1/3775/NSC_06610-R1_---NA---